MSSKTSKSSDSEGKKTLQQQQQLDNLGIP